MDKQLHDKIAAAIVQAESAIRMPRPYVALPGIIKTLNRFLVEDTMSLEKRKALISGMGRVILDNLNFADSELGTTLLELSDQIVPYEG